MAFLDKLPELVTRIRRATTDALKEVLKQDPTLVRNSATYSPQELQDGDVLNSSEFNYEQYALYLVLRSLYAQVTEIEATRTRHENILTESFMKSRAALLKALNDLRVFTFLQQFPEFDDVKFVDFNAARNLSERAPLADIDTESRFMRLAAVSRTAARVNRPNVDPKIEIHHFGGGRSESMIQDFNPARMIDGNQNTYWADLLVADGPITQDYTDSRGRSRIVRGLISEVHMHLAESSRINTIRLLPFGEYPIGVIDMAYKESVNQDNWKPIPDFVEGDATLDWVEVSFMPIQASVIRITLSQKNYVQGIYHLPASMVHNTNLLEHSIADAYRDRVGTSGISAPEVAQVAAFPELLGLLESLGEFDAEVLRSDMPEERVREYKLTEAMLRAMAKVLSRPDISVARDMLEPAGLEVTKAKEKLLDIHTTEYLVGIRELQPLYVTYAPVSYYASPQFTSSKTPVEVSVAVNEIHPIVSDDRGAYRLTGIDYELDLGEGLRLPIHPHNISLIQDEFILINRSTKVGYTRFLPDSEAVIVRRNGVRVKTDDYYFETDVNLAIGKLTILNRFASTAIYTITYSPHWSATRIELPATLTPTPLRLPESFNGTDDTNRIISKYIPYISWGVVNNDTDFSKREGEGVWEYVGSTSVQVDGTTYSTAQPIYEPIKVLVNNIKATNITDYEYSAQPLFTEIDPQSKLYQYFHVGNYFYFNAPIKDQQITVEYSWLTQYLQLVATMRTYKQAGVDVTPKINNYRIQIRTSPL